MGKHLQKICRICLLIGILIAYSLNTGGQANALGDLFSSNNSQTTATVLVMDISGSMADQWQGGVKLASAQQAANQIINMIQQDAQQGTPHKVGIVSFSEGAFTDLDLTSDYTLSRQVVDNLGPISATNIYAGLEMGNVVMNQADASDKKIMILLSDGMTNRGPERGEILSGPVAEAASQGACVYTIGFGDPGDLDEDLLRQIAAASGCGQYFYANDLYNLEDIYIRIRHLSGATLLGEFEGSIQQGETVEAGRINVTPDVAVLQYSLHWEGSVMELQIADPNGVQLDPTDSRINYARYGNLVYVVVDQPIPGEWVIKVYGADVPGSGERFRVLASGVISLTPFLPTPLPIPRPVEAPSSGGFGVALVLLILAASMLTLYIYQTNFKKNRPGGTLDMASGNYSNQKMNLLFITGPLTGQNFTYGLMSFSIGRGSANQLRIPDVSVSRLHATVLYQDGFWMIRDQNSRSGTYVNGYPISSAMLKAGDTLMIGSSQISVRIE